MTERHMLEVGHTTDFEEVVINNPELDPDEDGHLLFTPEQARHLANLLLKHADICDNKGGTA